MKCHNLNASLDKFFQSLSQPKDQKIKKTAVLGNFIDFNDPSASEEQDPLEQLPMMNELLKLPNYQSIISKLKGSIGMVNLIYRNGYHPLIELLLLKAFPAKSNDLFRSEEHSDYYFVPSEYFTRVPIPGVAQHVQPSRIRLDELLNGSRTKITREWLRSIYKYHDPNNKDAEHTRVSQLIGKPGEYAKELQNEVHPPEGFVPTPPERSPLGLNVARYEAGLQRIKDQHTVHINNVNQEIRTLVQRIKEINEDANLSEAKKKDQIRVTKEQINDKKRQREFEMDQARKARIALDTNIGEYITTDRVLNVSARDNDGFLSFNPQADVLKSGEDLYKKVLAGPKGVGSSASKHIEAVLTAVQTLRTKLINWNPSKQSLSDVRDEFVEYLGSPDHPVQEERLKVYNNIITTIKGRFVQLHNTIKEGVVSQNKVLILDDFDQSALCVKDPSSKKTTLSDNATRGLLSTAVGKNDSGLLRDDSQARTERGNRTVVVISSDPIDDLPSNSTPIDMGVSAVTDPEARIILKYILRKYGKEAQLKYKRRLYKEISDDYSQKLKENPSEEVKWKMERDQEEKMVNEKTEAMSSSLGTISEKLMRSMINSIQGLSVKDAIAVTRESLKAGLKYDDDLIDPEFSFDEAIVKDNLETTVNEIHGTGSLGLTDVKPNVLFENYSYRTGEDSPWGTRVPQIGAMGVKVKKLTDQIAANEEEMAQIDYQLNIQKKLPQNDPKRLATPQVQEKQKRKQALSNYNKNLRLQLESLSAHQFPHFYILWGRPGTGKSVWPEALANLLGLKIKAVDMGNQKSMWLGETEANARKLFSTMRSSRDLIFLFDEIDKQVVSNSGPGSGEKAHETTQHIIAELLKFFDNTENEKAFKQNNVYFVMTTNALENINNALVSRAEVQEVKLPNKPKDYKKFFLNNYYVEKRKDPYHPWFVSDTDIGEIDPATITDDTPEGVMDGWRTTELILFGGKSKDGKVYPGIDWDKVSEIFAARSDDEERAVDFRTLKQMMIEMWQQDASWRLSVENIGEGLQKTVSGAPATTENFIEAAEYVHTTAGGCNNINRGFLQMSTRRSTQVNEKLKEFFDKGGQLVPKTYVNPFTKDEKTILTLPDEFEKMARGESPEGEKKEEDEEGEYVQQKDPATGRMKTVWVPKGGKTPAQEMKDLSESGFDVKPLIPEGEEADELDLPDTPEPAKATPSPEEKGKEKQKKVPSPGSMMKEKQKEETIQSSTDYFYNYLKKNGFINEKGEFDLSVEADKKVEAKNLAKTNVKQPDAPWPGAPVDENGICTYHWGFTMIIPK